MQFLFYLFVLSIAFTVGMTISYLIVFFLFGLTPGNTSIMLLAMCWVMMLKFNPVWKELWDKWTKK
ncbi:hypothetical protein A8F94_14240 [Bacillus sp. FJAT-27225]|uniref:hypothetical protein n=1 Tax=Bacillus sp. FJAT-27225 TaxID=1743144 RepID=UPI00080C3276|nr:hypothetical protein [Bacillus sp. FJAT-27225]OCA86001.1 hypothetical protein A8F94_14240 [Bacillus sp. FJAT-27225]